LRIIKTLRRINWNSQLLNNLFSLIWSLLLDHWRLM